MVLTARIESPVVFEQDLTQLDDETYWKITYNKVTNAYKIERENPPSTARRGLIETGEGGFSRTLVIISEFFSIFYNYMIVYLINLIY